MHGRPSSLMRKRRNEEIQSPEVEAALIGAFLKDPSVIRKLELDPEVFANSRHRLIYKAMQEAIARGPVNATIVANLLDAWGVLLKCGGLAYLESLSLLDEADPAMAERYAEILVELWRFRTLREVARRIEELASARDPSVFAEAENLWRKAHVSPLKTIPHVEEVGREVLEMLDSPHDRSIPTPWVDYDEIVKLYPSTLHIVGARPGMGKSALALQMAEYAAERGYKTLYVSLEMSRRELLLRTISRITQIPATRILRRNIGHKDRLLIEEALERVRSWPLYILDDEVAGGLDAIVAKARRMRYEEGLDFLIVDYLQLAVDPRMRLEANVVQATAVISQTLKLLAKELDIPVVALSQLSRAVEHRTDKTPNLSDLRDSGALEQDADTITFIYREGYYKREENKDAFEAEPARLIVAKNRMGRLDSAELYWVGATTSFLTYADYLALRRTKAKYVDEPGAVDAEDGEDE